MVKPLPALIYDGDCGFCQASVRWLERRGAARVLAMHAFQTAPPEMALAGLAAADCREVVFVVDQSPAPRRPKVYRAAAAAFALRALPAFSRAGWRLLGWLYYLPGLRQVVDAGYAWVARNRHRLLPSHTWCEAPEATTRRPAG